MASKTQEEILKDFEKMAWQPAAGEPAEEPKRAYLPKDVGRAPHTASMTATAKPAVAGAAATPAGQNVRGSNSQTTSAGGGSTVATVLKDVFETGLGVVPLIGGILGLFGGGSETPPQPVKYQMPSAVSFMSADVGHDLLAADFDQMGLARQYESSGYGISDLAASDPAELSENADVPSGTEAVNRETGSNPATGQQPGTAAPAPQITVNVQAMDAQSLMDRSRDIAEAVRGAMLTMSSINDVVNEL